MRLVLLQTGLSFEHLLTATFASALTSFRTFAMTIPVSPRYRALFVRSSSDVVNALNLCSSPSPADRIEEQKPELEFTSGSFRYWAEPNACKITIKNLTFQPSTMVRNNPCKSFCDYVNVIYSVLEDVLAMSYAMFITS
jgi:hypothetical protein